MLNDPQYSGPSGRGKLLTLGALGAYLLGILLVGGGIDPDQKFSTFRHLAVGLTFAGWAASAFGWGATLVSGLRIDSNPALSLALGTGTYAILGGAMGHLGLLGAEMQAVWITVSCFGIGLLARLRLRPLSTPRGWVLVGVAVFVVSFLLHLVKAQLPSSHSDPLFYHLYAPWRWAERGSFYFIADSPVAMLASYWEYLHLWALRLLCSDPAHGLMEVQLFGQLTHLVLGYGGCALALYFFARRVFGASPRLAVACMLTGLQVREMVWVATTAKNDWGSTFWFLVAITELHAIALGEALGKAPRRLGTLAVTGVLLGLAVGAKYTQGLFAAIVIGGLAPWTAWRSSLRFSRQTLAFLPWVALFSALTVLPFLLRNYLMTGNPLFPYFSHLFGIADRLNPLFVAMIGSYENPSAGFPAIARIFGMVLEALAHEPMLVPSFVAFFTLPWLRRRTGSPSCLPWCVAGWLALLLFLFIGSNTEIRHFGAILVLLAAVAPIAALEILDAAGASRTRVESVVIALAICAHVLAGDFFRPGGDEPYTLAGYVRDAVAGPSTEQRIRTRQQFGTAKAWLRMNGIPDEPVVVTKNYQFYYITGRRVASFSGAAEFSDIISRMPSAEEMLRTLRLQHRYRYHVEVEVNPLERSPNSKAIDEVVARKPCIVVFGAPDARIIDLAWFDPGAPSECPSPPARREN